MESTQACTRNACTDRNRNTDTCTSRKADMDQELVSYSLFNPFDLISHSIQSTQQMSGELTRPNSQKHELITREFQAAPDYAKGVFIPEAESYLLNNGNSRFNKVCDKYAERDFDRYTPFNACMEMYISHEQNIVQTVDEKIGESTRPEGVLASVRSSYLPQRKGVVGF